MIFRKGVNSVVKYEVKPGTTPTHTIDLPFDASLVKDFRVSYAQVNRELVSKKKSDCELSGNSVIIRLTQQETFRFAYGKVLEVQIRGITTGNDVFESEIVELTVGKSLNKEVLS